MPARRRLIRNLGIMKAHQVLHSLAILLLLIVAIMNNASSLHQIPGAPLGMRLAPFLGVAIWSWLIWKIWTRPRNWGLGVGIFLFVIIAFQTYLWHKANANPDLKELVAGHTLEGHIRYELPIFAAGVCCLLLRFLSPKEFKNSTR